MLSDATADILFELELGTYVDIFCDKDIREKVQTCFEESFAKCWAAGSNPFYNEDNDNEDSEDSMPIWTRVTNYGVRIGYKTGCYLPEEGQREFCMEFKEAFDELISAFPNIEYEGSVNYQVSYHNGGEQVFDEYISEGRSDYWGRIFGEALSQSSNLKQISEIMEYSDYPSDVIKDLYQYSKWIKKFDLDKAVEIIIKAASECDDDEYEDEDEDDDEDDDEDEDEDEEDLRELVKKLEATCSFKSSFNFNITFVLKDKKKLSFAANGESEIPGDYFKHAAIVKVSPKELGESNDVEELIKLLIKGVYEADNGNKRFIFSEPLKSKKNPCKFIDNIRSKIKSMNDIELISLESQTYHGGSHLQKYVYNVDKKSFVGMEYGSESDESKGKPGEVLIDTSGCQIIILSDKKDFDSKYKSLLKLARGEITAENFI